MEAKKRLRKLNFHQSEILILLEELQNEHSILFSSHSSTVTNKKKKILWDCIVQKMNSLGIAHRTIQEIKEKWKSMKRAVLARKQNQNKSGGGPPEAALPYEEIIFSIIGEKSNLISGIDVKGTDSFEKLEDIKCNVSPPHLLENVDDSVTEEKTFSIEVVPPDTISEDALQETPSTSTATTRPAETRKWKILKKASTSNNSNNVTLKGDDLLDAYLLTEIKRNELQCKSYEESSELHVLKKQKLMLEIKLLESQLENTNS